MRFDRTIAYRNRNPLNIRCSAVKWQGKVDNGGGEFEKFSSFTYGYRAAVVILRSYHLKGIRSIRSIIETWAPRTENETDLYIKSVIKTMNGFWRIDLNEGDYCPKTQLNLRDREMVMQLLYAMTKVEMGASTAQMHQLKSYIYLGFDIAVTRKDFYKGIG